VVLYGDILQAGADTTSNSLSFTLLLLTCHTEVQDKVYQEILNVVGIDRLPGLDDKIM